VAKGRCDHCQGEGFVFVEMLFLPSVYAPCPTCRGARYNAKTLEVTYRDKTIADVLGMTVDEAFAFFAEVPALHRALDTVRQVGIGYLRLGQPATELSGGEAQRIKLSSELHKRATGNTLYVLDEPTTGLHFEDVRKLLGVLQRLVDTGNTVLVIEHNLDVIKTADHLIDMGPEGGDKGGSIVAIGSPEQVAADPASHTGRFLAEVLERPTLPLEDDAELVPLTGAQAAER
jgi:excinuclease ABC subunit A